ncbi:MAG: hypothetical protein AAF170_13750 [Bacteroidota bacterium]
MTVATSLRLPAPSRPSSLWWALLALALATYGLATPAHAQFNNRWLAGGSFHSWYSEVGGERESGGFVGTQQDGMRWPGIYSFRDMQAAKGMWIGAQNVRDDAGNTYPIRVVHVGPRVSGAGEFFPVRFDLEGRFEPGVVTVDGEQSFPSAEMIVDRVDPDLPADFVLTNEVNTLLGITMERKIMQFSQGYNDNYHIFDVTFTNTGNTDGDPDIELPNQTLEGVWFFPQYRLSVAKESRFMIGNSSGWGTNAMNDARGDGVEVDPPGEQFRAQFTWHGKFPGFTAYDNLGASLQTVNGWPVTQVPVADSLGRLAASAFVGVVTLHADASATDDSDDVTQPATTTYFDSDAPFTSQNDPFSPSKMQVEYNLMTGGNKAPRHAKVVEPSGLPGFIAPTGDPQLTSQAGFSFANGYGPYTLGPGESIRIVWAEGAAGLSREANTAIGRAFLESGNDAGAGLTWNGETRTKNEWIFTGRDSLFQTFQRATEAFEADYNIARAPAPPAAFAVNGGGDRIQLTWDPPANGETPSRYEVYRARGSQDSTYTLVYSGSDTSFDDTTPIRGVGYYYYVQSVIDGRGDGVAGVPAGAALRSSRYFAQTYSPALLARPQGNSLDEIRIVPNPFNIGAAGQFRFQDDGETNKLAFFNIPGQCRIDIYTEIGELVDTIEHTNGTGDDYWDHTTSSRQVVASGVYIAFITVTEDIPNPDGSGLLYQRGERAFKKFVIIR